MPCREMTNSPWIVPASDVAVTDLTGDPANRSRKASLQATSKPQLAGRKGMIRTLRAFSHGTQAASEPRRGQLAPPRASRHASARTSKRPAAVSNVYPSFSNPIQRWRGMSRTPWCSSRRSQDRSSGEAFMTLGNTRPELPTKVSVPRPWAQLRMSCGGNSSSAGRSRAVALPKRVRNVSYSSEWVMLRPDLPASRNLRPNVGMASKTVTSQPEADKTSAAMRPAGPPPMIAMVLPFIRAV